MDFLFFLGGGLQSLFGSFKGFSTGSCKGPSRFPLKGAGRLQGSKFSVLSLRGSYRRVGRSGFRAQQLRLKLYGLGKSSLNPRL